jgi:hypothetical protein
MTTPAAAHWISQTNSLEEEERGQKQCEIPGPAGENPGPNRRSRDETMKKRDTEPWPSCEPGGLIRLFNPGDTRHGSDNEDGLGAFGQPNRRPFSDITKAEVDPCHICVLSCVHSCLFSFFDLPCRGCVAPHRTLHAGIPVLPRPLWTWVVGTAPEAPTKSGVSCIGWDRSGLGDTTARRRKSRASSRGAGFHRIGYVDGHAPCVSGNYTRLGPTRLGQKGARRRTSTCTSVAARPPDG